MPRRACGARARHRVRRWPQDPALSVREAFHAEQANLMALPEREYALAERLAVTAGKTPWGP